MVSGDWSRDMTGLSWGKSELMNFRPGQPHLLWPTFSRLCHYASRLLDVGNTFVNFSLRVISRLREDGSREVASMVVAQQPISTPTPFLVFLGKHSILVDVFLRSVRHGNVCVIKR